MTDRCHPLDWEWDELWEKWATNPTPVVDLPQISDEDWERMAAERRK